MSNGKKNIAEKVQELITPTVLSLGYSLWDVEYVKEGADWCLRVTIDSDKGIDLNDVERVHRAIDPIIDAADPIEDSYYLNVSSPGIERNIRTDAHYRACVGKKVEVRLFTSLDNCKKIVGILESVSEDGNTVEINAGGKLHPISKNLISKANVSYDFGDELSKGEDNKRGK